MIPVEVSANAKIEVKNKGQKSTFNKMLNKDLFVYSVYNLIFSGGKISISVCTDKSFN